MPEPGNPGHVVIAGAGAIGCFVGGLLMRGGHHVSFLGRRMMLDVLRANGLLLSDYAGLATALEAATLDLHEDPQVLCAADVVLVCVKSAATGEMADLLAAHLAPKAIVVSLQNGMGHAQTLRAALPGHDVRAGMVPFNVVLTPEGRFHRATSGDIVIGAGSPDLGKMLSVADLQIAQSDEIEAVQWGKFLLNLTNAPNALSGLALRAQLMDRDWRRLIADQMAEALRVLRAHGCAIRPMTPLPVGLTPHVLRLPTPLFRRVAARMLIIDLAARTSMAHDLAAGRPTEVDALQGRIIEMGKQKALPTPLAEAMLAAVKQAEVAGLVPCTAASLRG